MKRLISFSAPRNGDPQRVVVRLILDTHEHYSEYAVPKKTRACGPWGILGPP